MTYLTWRQHRQQALVALALLAAFAVLMLITGLQAAAQWHAALAGCSAARACGSLRDIFLGSHAVGFLVVLTLIVPALLGMLLGAPLVAHELEARTTQFAWTQGATRARWLAVRVGWLLLGTAAFAGAVSALVTWWSGPANAQQASGFNPGRFDIMGIAPVGYTVFAVALGITAGTVIRRVVPAIGITVAGFIAVRAAVFIGLRQHYQAAVTHVYGLTQSFAPPGAAWQLAAGVVAPGGGRLSVSDGPAIAMNVSSVTVPASCRGLEDGATLSCMQAAGFRQFITYQPAGRYWAFQAIEAGIFVTLAAALIAVAFVVLRRRDA
jgi:hypothetical protein